MEAMTDQPPPSGPEDGPLVALTFQKNPQQVLKYLEAEPKALGVTEIFLSIFTISTSLITLTSNLEHENFDIAHIVLSLFVIVAGGVAIAARNLHQATLNACLALQVIACIASVISFLINCGKLVNVPLEYRCLEEYSLETSMCNKLINGIQHYHAVGFVVHTALIAISATLAAYCCKVINCCCPKSKMVRTRRGGSFTFVQHIIMCIIMHTNVPGQGAVGARKMRQDNISCRKWTKLGQDTECLRSSSCFFQPVITVNAPLTEP
ncbi:hypothetical protein GN956_G15493 [Arapaima gigas]